MQCNPAHPTRRDKTNMKPDTSKETTIKVATSLTTATVNLVLGIVKTLVGVYTNSISILTDGVNNFGDTLTGAGATAGFLVEGKKPTEKFPFGFGRVEYIVTFVMAIVIVAVGGAFAYSAGDRIFYHPVVTFSWVQFGVIAATIAIKIALAVLSRFAFKRYGSDVLKAMTTDSVMDSFVTLFALTGLFLSRYIAFPVDAVIGLVISAIMIAAGVKLFLSAFFKLVGGRDARREDGLKKLSLSLKGVTDARVRVYDFGAKHAEAVVSLTFEENFEREDISAIENKISAVAAEHGIVVVFAESKEE